jgi:hypothetical protein
MAVLVRRAIDEYLAENFRDSDDWGERFDALVKRVQSRIPSGITPEQIEADITAAREEARRARQKGHNS